MSVVDELRAGPVVARLRDDRVLAILRGLPPAEVARVADGLQRGGVGAIEVTLDSPGALDSIRDLAARDGVLAGAGTVRTPAAVDAAVGAGARFVVAPGFSAAVVERCLGLGVPAVPGALTPTEIEAAWDAGAALVKLFPGGLGGPRYVADVHAPLRDVPLVVTGGVTALNARAFLDAGAVAVGVGGALGHAPDPEAAARELADALRTA